METRLSREELQTVKLLAQHLCSSSHIFRYLLQTECSCRVPSTPTSPSPSKTMQEKVVKSDVWRWTVWCFLGDPVEKIHNPKKVGLKIESSWLSHRHQVLKGTVSSRSHPPAEHKQLKGYGKHSPGPGPGAKWRSPSNPEIRRGHLQQKHELCCFWRRLASDCTLV